MPSTALSLQGGPDEPRAQELHLAELRELARGTHPAILTARGLGPALEALTARCSVPVTIEGFPEKRFPPAVEVAAYYLVSEALTNVAKYAQATTARVSVFERPTLAIIEIADDGIGGADPSMGSGLQGLTERIGALGGRVVVESPPGRGTTIRAEIPM